METKILLHLIRDDIKILESINDSFLEQSDLLPEEVEVALVRSRAVVMEFEMLSKNLIREDESLSGNGPNQNSVEKTEKKARSLRNFLPFIKSEEDNSAVQSPDKAGKPNPAFFSPVNDLPESPLSNKANSADKITSVPVSEIQISEESKEDSTALIEITEETIEISETEVRNGNEPEVVNEELNKILSGESSENKFGVIPLKNLQEGIGLNDRFLFIRELFRNNSEEFNQTITALDEFTNIEDAVKYLKKNFKWNKSEAGEKFLFLIKRRFVK